MTPSDPTTLVEVIEGYRKEGFDSDFSALDGALIRCEACAAESDATEFVIRSLRRLEGASDPDDNLAVVATQCPNCQAEGTLILGYGPMASGADTDVATSMKDERPTGPEGDGPQVSTPGAPGT